MKRSASPGPKRNHGSREIFLRVERVLESSRTIGRSCSADLWFVSAVLSLSPIGKRRGPVKQVCATKSATSVRSSTASCEVLR